MNNSTKFAAWVAVIVVSLEILLISHQSTQPAQPVQTTNSINFFPGEPQ